MRRFITAMSVVAGLAVVTAPVLAQQGQQQRGERPGFARGAGAGAGAMVRNPAAAVLAQRAELGLTADQVRQIEAIQARVERDNAPRLEQLRAAHGEQRQARADMTQEERQAARQQMRERHEAMTQEERDAMRAQMRDRMQAQREQLAPVHQAVRETNRAAGEEIRAILTAEQQQQLRQSMRRAAPERRGEWQRGDRPRRDGERGDRQRRGPRGGGGR